MALKRIRIAQAGSGRTETTRRKRGRPAKQGSETATGIEPVSSRTETPPGIEAGGTPSAEIVGDAEFTNVAVDSELAGQPELTEDIKIEGLPRKRRAKRKQSTAAPSSGDPQAAQTIIALLSTVGIALSDAGPVNDFEALLIIQGLNSLPAEKYAAAFEKLAPVAVVGGVLMYGYRVMTNRKQAPKPQAVERDNPHVTTAQPTPNVVVNPFINLKQEVPDALKRETFPIS